MRLPALLTKRSALAAGITGALIAGAVIGVPVIGPAAAQGTASPWAPAGVDEDQNAIGGLTFYNASGTVITSGPTDTAPFVAFVEGRKTIRAGDTKATLSAYLPQEGVNPANWGSNEQLGLSTVYPNTGAPAPVNASTLPVNTGGGSDLTLDTVASDFPNASSTPGYQNVYEIRMYTNKPGDTSPPQYDYADISINSATHTWTLVWTPDAPNTVHSSALTNSAPASVQYNASATISTKLTDTTASAPIAGASVTLYRRPKSTAAWSLVKTLVTSSTGAASTSVKMTANAQFQWRYAATTGHAAATSPTKSVSVTQVIAIHATPTSVRHGNTLKIWGTVQPAGSGQAVTLQKQSGTRWVNTATATLKLQKLPNGTTTVGYVFAVRLATIGTFKYRVTKAATATLAAGTSPIVTVKAT